MKEDGTLCGLGDNSFWQLGLIYKTNIFSCSIEDLIVSTEDYQHRLTVNKTGNGTVIDKVVIDCDTDCSIDYDNNNIIDLTSFDYGYITVNKNNGLIDCGITCSADYIVDYLQDKMVTLVAIPDEDYIFTGWSNDCSGIDDTTTITMDEAKNCNATFESLQILETYTLTVNGINGSVTGTGINCGSDCNEDYDSDTTVTLTTNPDTDYSFNGWNGSCSGSNSKVTITLNQNMNCSANFNKIYIPDSLPTYPNIHVYPTELEFITNENSFVDRNITVSNTGDGKLYIKNILLDDSDFIIIEDNCFKQWIDSDSNCELTVQFQSKSNLLQTAILSIDSNDSDTQLLEIKLQGHISQDDSETYEAIQVKVITQENNEEVSDSIKTKPIIQKGNNEVTADSIDNGNSGNSKVTNNNQTNTDLVNIIDNPTNNSSDDSKIPADNTSIFTKFNINEPMSPNVTTTLPIMSNSCSSNITINRVCSNNWQVLTGVTLGENSSVSGGELAGNIENKGLVSQVTIQPGAVVTGGKFTGYIKNDGTMVDFEFVGASLSGGTLAGTVLNNSTIGEIRDVKLAAGAEVIGGTLAGDIQGDCDNPAKLQNVIIKAGSKLSCVIIDSDSVLEDNVTFGAGMQQSSNLVPVHNLLPMHNVTVINGTEIPDDKFFGGIVNSSSSINVRGWIVPESIDQDVDILVVIDKIDGYVMLNSAGEQVAWDGQIDNLIPFQTVSNLDKPIHIYNGDSNGMQKFYFGYRLNDGTIIYSEDGIEVN